MHSFLLNPVLQCEPQEAMEQRLAEAKLQPEGDSEALDEAHLRLLQLRQKLAAGSHGQVAGLRA